MTNPIRTCVAGALVAAVALPASAVAAGHGGPGGNASARTKQRVHRVHIALEKAVDAIDDGDEAKAVTKLGAVDKHLGRALKAATRQAGGEKGPASLGLVAKAADEVALVTADSLDESGQTLSDALVATMDGALDDRDAIVDTIGGLEDPSDYDHALERIAEQADEEAESFEEGVQDDTLVPSAEQALTDAAAQAAATSDEATTLADSIEASEEEGETAGEGEEGGDCPEGGPRGPRHPGPGPAGDDPQEAPSLQM